MDVQDGVHVVGLCGSRRDGSYTRRALEVVLEAAEARGATTDLVDVGVFDLPVFDPDRPDAGDAEALRRRVRDADAVVLGTPMYHGSYSSTLKTALDYCGFDEFAATTVGLLAVAGGGFPTPALDHLRGVARALDAWVLPHQVAIANSHSVFDGGQLVDEDLRERAETLGREIVAYAGVESYPNVDAGRATTCAD